MKRTFTPKIFDTLKSYTKAQFYKDLMAGIIVGIVSLPLAIAFGIASGVTPEKGLITAVIGGFIISLLGGSRVQIGGPTGAFIVIVYGIVQKFGFDGLVIATFIAGIILVLLGFARLGNIIKFIPYPLVVVFTSGIALIIFSSQMKDFLGLEMGKVSVDFLDKWIDYFKHIESMNVFALSISIATVLICFFWPKKLRKVPGSLIAIFLCTFIVHYYKLPVETIGSRFGVLKTSFSTPTIPRIDWSTFKSLISPAFAIALLGGIESLLSAVVADGMIGGHHKSNMELVAQGTANMASAVFGGIPATGAIARTATNIKNGGRTPVAGIIHALVLLLIMLFIGRWASYIPMATLSGILVVVAYNMSEWKNFVSIFRGQRSDMLVLIVTFLLTVLIDLTVAIEIGMLFAVFLFMRDMTKSTNIQNIQIDQEDDSSEDDPLAVSKFQIPDQIEVYEINGPMFFGAAFKFRDAMQEIEKNPKILILRMRNVPYIDATGIRTIKEVLKDMKQRGIRLVLSGITSQQVIDELKKSRLSFMIGKANIKPIFPEALDRAKFLLNKMNSGN